MQLRPFSDPIVLQPEVDFRRLSVALASLGYERDAAGAIVREPEPVEPEQAGFHHDSGAELTYTYNPIVRLRVLSPRGTSRGEWLKLERGLTCLSRSDHTKLLESDDPQALLLGLFAADLLEEPAFFERALQLRSHGERAVAEVAAKVSASLESHARARSKALELMGVLCAQMCPMLSMLPVKSSQDLATALEPRPEDYAAVFEPEAVERARVSYRSFWRGNPRIEPAASASVLRVSGAPAGMLLRDNELSFQFPTGYRDVAHLLVPSRVWMTWGYETPGESSGLELDGLVVLGSRTVWFPKPFRYLAHHQA
ncbi:MAG: hypothetical protein HOW73_38915 [Polyangiaceae bacterium]|nr:hypothetical protein [Polyangiaceae bacterium]